MKSLGGWLLLGTCLGLAACGDSNTDTGCTKDSDCKSGFFCQENACYCRTDDACDAGEYCNASGSCQSRPACIGNQDCAAGMLCNSADPSGGVCIPAEKCGSSIHCPFNEYCNPSTLVCTAGCSETADCELGRVCVGRQCVPSHTGSDCSICPTTPIPDPSYCDYGETCDPITGNCVPATNSNLLCTDCTHTNSCAGNLVCLIDPDTDNSSYCSPGCTTNDDCPAGYSDCSGLTMVFKECDTAADCGDGRECRGRSESNRGFCSCTDSTDCDMYTGICQEQAFGGSACFLSLCDPNTSGTCSQFGSDVQCKSQLGYLCQGLFSAKSCTYSGCEGDADCTQFGSDVTCQSGVCTGKSCSNGNDCICANNRCVLDGSACTTGADCLGGYCVKSCATDMDCMCLNGRCAGSELPCQAPADCAINCEEGSCITSAKACGKESGASCADILDGSTAECRQY